MSKIMVFNVPAYGHVNVTLPVVHELTNRGHEVRYYCTEEFRSHIEATGAVFMPYPTGIPASKTFSEKAHNLVNISLLLVDASAVLTPFVIEEIEREQPDAVLYDIINLWARIATHVSGTPTITSFSVAILEGVKNIIDTRMMAYILLTSLPKIHKLLWLRAKLVRKYGSEAVKFPLFPSVGQLNLVFTSRDFQMDTPFIDDSFEFVGASLLPELRPEPLLDLSHIDTPIVYISLGTVNNNNLHFYTEVFKAFSNYPATFILSIGNYLTADDLHLIPDNFRVMNTVPQLQVLQQADAFVTHGGMNSIQEAIYYGVPMVVVPQQMEQMINGRRVEELGIGKVVADKLPFWKITADELRHSVDDILLMPAYKENAGNQRQLSHNAGGYVKAAVEIESIIGD